MEENKEILELLKQLEKTNRQQALTGRLMCVFALVTAVCFVVTCVLVFSVLPQVNAVMAQVQTVLGNLEQTTRQLAALDLEGMVGNMDTLVRTGQQSLEQGMDKLNRIDLDTLNQAIQDLSEVVEPMSRFFQVFKK